MPDDFWISLEGLMLLQAMDSERADAIRRQHYSQASPRDLLELAHLIVAMHNRQRLIDALEQKPNVFPF